MAVVYLEGTFQLGGLNLKTREDLQELNTKLREAVLSMLLMHPHLSHPMSLTQSDWDIEIETQAGNFEDE
jgi:hypothetical protein